MTSLKQTIASAKEGKYALGHFNFSTMDNLHAVISGAISVDVPAVVGLSEGERDFFGIEEAVATIKAVRERTNYPIFLNADHTYSFERVKEVIDAGFDSVIFDGTELESAENIRITKQCVDYAHAQSREVLVEAEIGYIGKSSKMLDSIPDDAATTLDDMPSVAEIQNFVAQTGVDLIAPAVGNIHGMLKNAPNPRLAIDHIRDISTNVAAPIVLHGGSGIADDDFRQAIQAGVAMVHINTEMRKAWKEVLVSTLAQDPDEVAPYKMMRPSQKAVQAVVEGRLRLFAGK